MSPLTFLTLFLFLAAAATSQAQVPPAATFSLENSGDFGDFIVEYDGSYRALSVFNSPFQLCFFNTTPGEYTLALRMGLVRDESLFRWVWEANRGNPVGENATFSLRPDGNLVLAHSDGRVAWQTNTSRKGVTGFKLLSNGNMVLHDKNGRFVWQSFDSPTDTLLVGQSLRVGNKLVSRLSDRDNKDGPYTLDLKLEGMFLSYKKMLYHSFLTRNHGPDEALTNVTMRSVPETDENVAWEVSLDLSTGGKFLMTRPKYNSTLSFMRLGIDGSIKFYTYYSKVSYLPWDVVYELFSRDGFETTECQLPARCGSLGICEDSQCVACPTEKGLLGWSKTCAAKKVSCNPSQFHYYKVEGVDHFLSNFNRGSSVSESDCGKKCTSNCKCLGYFYNKDTSRCWQASELKTLAKVANSTHVGYIKTPNK